MAVKVYCEEQKSRRAEMIRNIFFCGRCSCFWRKKWVLQKIGLPISSWKGKKDGGAGSRVVPRAARETWVPADDLVSIVVEENGVLVSEDEEIAIGGQVHKRVQIVLGTRVVSLGQEWQLDRSFSSSRHKFVVELPSTSDHNHSLVWQQLVAGVPARLRKRIGILSPVVVSTRPDCTHSITAVIPSPRLRQSPTRLPCPCTDRRRSWSSHTCMHACSSHDQKIKHNPSHAQRERERERERESPTETETDTLWENENWNSTWGAPGISEDSERSDSVCSEVELDGVSPAVDLQSQVAGVATTEAIGEPDLGGTIIRSVEHDHFVGVRQCHVHRWHARVWNQHLPTIFPSCFCWELYHAGGHDDAHLQ